MPKKAQISRALLSANMGEKEGETEGEKEEEKGLSTSDNLNASPLTSEEEEKKANEAVAVGAVTVAHFSLHAPKPAMAPL
jgi:hypothetical protein